MRWFKGKQPEPSVTPSSGARGAENESPAGSVPVPESAPDVAAMENARDVDGLIAVVKAKGGVITRMEATRVLGDLADERAVEPLIEAFQSNVRILGGMIALVRGEPDMPDLPDMLIASTMAGAIAIWTAEALGKLGDERAVEPLTAVLEDGNLRETAESVKPMGAYSNKEFQQVVAGALKAAMDFPPDDKLSTLSETVKWQAGRLYETSSKALEQIRGPDASQAEAGQEREGGHGMSFKLEPTDTAIVLGHPFGAAIPTVIEEDGKHLTCFLFRESEERIRELASESAVEVRANLLGVAGVLLYVTLIRIGDQVFEMWWNWHNPVLRPRLLNLLDQDELVIAWLSDSPTPIAVTRYPWAGRRDLSTAVQARGEFEGSEPWSMEAFEKARNAVYESYPTPVALWQALPPAS